MKRKALVVMGAYGCGNRGDDAILQSISENFPEFTIYAACGKFENIEQWLPVKRITCRLNEGFSIPVLFSMVKTGILMIWRISCSEAILFGGGSLLHDLTGYNLPFMFLWQVLAKLMGKKVYYISMGIGPLQTERGKKITKRFLSKADGVFVRDQRGMQYCQELMIPNPVFVRDAAFLTVTKNQYKGKTLSKYGLQEKKYVCITASQWFQSSNFWNRKNIDFTEQRRNFRLCAEGFQKTTGMKMVFVPTVYHDVEIGKMLSEDMDKEQLLVVPATLNSKEMAEIIENSFLLMGVRMHSMIFAARQGVPFVPLVYDEKVKQLLNLLNMDRYAIDISEITPEKVILYTEQIISEYQQIHKMLMDKTQQFKDINLRMIDKIKKDING